MCSKERVQSLAEQVMATALEDLRSPAIWRAVAAEMTGTLLLVLVGCGSAIGWGPDYTPSVVQIALCFGLSVGTLVWILGHVSGGHINPAVSVAFLVTRKISLVRFFLYLLGQCVGAIIGAAILKGLTPHSAQGRLGATVPDPSMGQSQAFGVEFFVTFVLVFAIFACCDNKRTDLAGSIPLTIGLTVTMVHLFAVKYTGCGLNPARSFGPAVVQGVWNEHWVYWCGPMLGGIVGAVVYDNVFASNASLAKAKGYLMANRYDPDDDFDGKQSEPLQTTTCTMVSEPEPV